MTAYDVIVISYRLEFHIYGIDKKKVIMRYNLVYFLVSLNSEVSQSWPLSENDERE